MSPFFPVPRPWLGLQGALPALAGSCPRSAFGAFWVAFARGDIAGAHAATRQLPRSASGPQEPSPVPRLTLVALLIATDPL